MDKNTVITGVLLDEHTTTFTFTQVCHTYHIPEDVLIELLEHGLFSEITPPIEQVNFNPYMLTRIQSARRLQEDLGVNPPGVILALELRDELERIREELDILRRHVGYVQERS